MFESLSDEFLVIILSKMSMSDRIKMSGVSKRFARLVKQKYDPIISVAVCADYNVGRNRWFLAGDIVSLREQLFTNLSLDYPAPILRRLQRLKIQGTLPFSDFVRLERFPLLNALDISCLEFGDRVQTVQLDSLQFLRVINISRPHPQGGYLIRGDQMVGVCFGEDSINHIRLSNPKTVTYLEFQRDDATKRDSLTYTSAVIVRCNQIFHLDLSILSGLIADLPQVKRYYFNVQELTNLSSILFYGSGMNLPEANARLAILYDVLVQAKLNKEQNARVLNPMVQPSIEMSLNEMLINPDRPYPGEILLGSLVYQHYRNFGRLNHRINSVCAMNYGEVMNIVQMFPPFNFIIKYPYLSQITLTRHENRPLRSGPVLLFLRHYQPTAIQCLIMNFTGLEQDFYDSLPDAAPSLTNLCVLDNDRINFDFLFHLEWLHIFSTNLMSRRMLLEKLEQFSYNSSFELVLMNKNSLYITKQKPDQYDMTVRENLQGDRSGDGAPAANVSTNELAESFNFQEHLFEDLTFAQLQERLNENFPMFAHWYD